jgi:hypothetical protein
MRPRSARAQRTYDLKTYRIAFQNGILISKSSAAGSHREALVLLALEKLRQLGLIAASRMLAGRERENWRTAG